MKWTSTKGLLCLKWWTWGEGCEKCQFCAVDVFYGWPLSCFYLGPRGETYYPKKRVKCTKIQHFMQNNLKICLSLYVCILYFVCFCFILHSCCIIVLSTAGLAWWDWGIILRTYNNLSSFTVSWVIWPVKKPVPDRTFWWDVKPCSIQCLRVKKIFLRSGVLNFYYRPTNKTKWTQKFKQHERIIGRRQHWTAADYFQPARISQ